MIADILMAFVIALFLEMFSLWHERFKQLAIAICCCSLILVYFTSNCHVAFVGEIDLAIWIAFVIIFDEALMFAIKQLKK